MNNEISLSKAIALRSEKRFEESLFVFKKLEPEYISNSEFCYQYAWLLDNMDSENEACIYYQKAIDLGLDGEDLKGCMIGLGSSYRNVGKLEKSLEILSLANDRFPDSAEIQVFIVLTLHDMNRKSEAISILLNLLIDSTDDKGIQDYKTALQYYSNQLIEK